MVHYYGKGGSNVLHRFNQCQRKFDISQEEIIMSAHKLIFGSFSRKDGGDPVRILPVPDDERDEFGIVEIDVAQSREPERLDLLKKVFHEALCRD